MNTAMNFIPTHLRAAVAACAFLSAPVWASEAVLLQGETIAITATDMEADALRMPPEMRSTVLARPQTVMQIASNLYGRRMMAIRAKAEGLDADPITAAALQIAIDKVLSDAMLAKIDKEAMPNDVALDGLARNIYTAKPERFKAQEQVQVRHILIGGVDDSSRVQAEKTLQELRDGADFAKLAQERSTDKGSAAKGGDLGYFARGRMVPEFEEAAFALQKPGELSGLVKSKFGYHIIKFIARKPAGVRPFDEVREDLVKEVRNEVLQEARAAEAAKLQQSAKMNNEAIEAFAASYSKESKGSKKAP